MLNDVLLSGEISSALETYFIIVYIFFWNLVLGWLTQNISGSEIAELPEMFLPRTYFGVN